MKNHNLKRYLCILLAGLFSLSMSGCYNYRELNEVSIVVGVAVDQDPTTGEFLLTTEVMNYNADEDGKKTIIIKSRGESFFDAIRNGISICGHKFYWGHCEVAVFGKEFAETGIDPVVDYVMRDAEPRMSMEFLVSRENTAEEILSTRVANNDTTGLGIKEILTSSSSVSKAMSREVYRVSNDLLSEGTSTVLPTAYLVDNGGKKNIAVSGSAFFRHSKLAGFLDPDETMMLMFIVNKIEGGLLVVNDPATGEDITLEILGNTTKIIPRLAGNECRIFIDIRTNVAVGEVDLLTDDLTEGELEDIESLAEDMLNEKVAKMIAKIQTEYQTDIFGFNNKVRENLPAIWEEQKNLWPIYFSQLPVEVQCKVEIENTGGR